MPLIEDRDDLDAEGQAAGDHVASSRGRIVAPTRRCGTGFESVLPGTVRELAIISTELLTFVIGSGKALAASLDYEATLRNISHMAVPDIADWCAIHLVDNDGELTQVSLAHADPGRLAWAQRMQATYRPPRETPLRGAGEGTGSQFPAP